MKKRTFNLEIWKVKFGSVLVYFLLVPYLIYDCYWEIQNKRFLSHGGDSVG